MKPFSVCMAESAKSFIACALFFFFLILQFDIPSWCFMDFYSFLSFFFDVLFAGVFHSHRVDVDVNKSRIETRKEVKRSWKTSKYLSLTVSTCPTIGFQVFFIYLFLLAVALLQRFQFKVENKKCLDDEQRSGEKLARSWNLRQQNLIYSRVFGIIFQIGLNFIFLSVSPLRCIELYDSLLPAEIYSSHFNKLNLLSIVSNARKVGRNNESKKKMKVQSIELKTKLNSFSLHSNSTLTSNTIYSHRRCRCSRLRKWKKEMRCYCELNLNGCCRDISTGHSYDVECITLILFILYERKRWDVTGVWTSFVESYISRDNGLSFSFYMRESTS